MATIGVNLALSSGKINLTLELYAAGVLLNTGGDALVEVGTSGYFEATVAETISVTLDAVIKEGGVIVAGGVLYFGQSVVGRIASAPTAAANASQVRTELATELGRIDAAISSRSTFAGGEVASVAGAVGSVTAPVTVGTNNDKTGYSIAQVFPANFAALGISSLGYINRVTLVDTTTTNTDVAGVLRVGESYTHTNSATLKTATVIITATP